MTIYPAIDIKDGRCVRLLRGDFNEVKDYGDPFEWAQKWENEGAKYLHLVDLDAALTGQSNNLEIIKKICLNVKIPVQLGGGVRTKDDVKIRLLDLGISRIIVGTQAVENPDFVSWIRGKFDTDQVVVGIDAKDGKVLTRGWVEESEKESVELAREMQKLGISSFVYTDVSKDGAMEGPNLEKTEELVKATWADVIASGGISSLQDITNVKSTGACGVIVGKALYEGAFTLKQALAL